MNAKQKREKRVALAKDVLAQLDAYQLRPEFGAYVCRMDDDKCRVCALGALVVACCGVPKETRSMNEDEVVECLAPLFSVKDMAIIEAAFEADSEMPIAEYFLRREPDTHEPRKTSKATELALAKAANWSGHNTPREALRAVMQNIIDNNGAFAP